MFGSSLVAMAWERWTRPSLSIAVDAGRARGPAHEFFHLVVENRRTGPVDDLWPGLRVAWSCTATLEVLDAQGNSVFPPVAARWTSQPEPIQSVGTGNVILVVPDVARMLAARRVDIHSHVVQQLSVLVKHQGDPDCHVFTNESYVFPRWSNPAWRLGLGRHHLRVAVDYELGRKQADFWIHNDGTNLDDVRIESRISSRAAG